MNETLFIVLLAFVAFAYAMVGHGGASGYLALMGIAGIAPATMKPSALVLNLCVSIIAFAQFARSGHFKWRLFWPFALLSVPCAFFAAGIELDKATYLRLLGICVVIASLRMLGLFSQRKAEVENAPLVLALIIGAAIGLVAGVLGIGGGIILSPVLLLCGWADAKTAAATSSLFIFVNSAAGLLKLQNIGTSFTSNMLLWAAVALAGGILGSWVGARKAPEPRLRQALGVVLLLASIKLIWP